jgi:CSLREA domain-containing protein
VLALVVLVAVASCLVPTASPAQTFPPLEPLYVINSTFDAADANPGDNLCDADGVTVGEQCTLRAAVQEANAVPGRANITLPAGEYTLTIPNGSPFNVTVGDLDVTDDLIIAGAGARTTIVQGGGRHTTTGTSKPALPRRSVVLL